MSWVGTVTGRPSEGLSRLPEASISILASRWASVDSGRGTAIWSPSKSALKGVQTRSLNIGGLDVVLQHNPARMISSAAKLDKSSIAARPCFLCNRFPEQTFIRFDGRKGKKYDILLNPYPIFPDHLVIAL